ncbi:Fasciclin-like arabinogalactan protein 2 [Bienertia sinuspersici]
MHAGKVGFAPADSGEPKSFFVKAVEEMPYNISILHISKVLDSEQAEAPTPEPSKLNLTSLLYDKGCKEFSRLLTSTGADKIFQENIESGLTVFCVGDSAVKAFMPKFKNLTEGNQTSLILYHGVPVYNSMGMLKSSNGIMNTLATEGSKKKYDFTVQNHGEKVSLKTKIVTAKVTGTLVDKDPLAVFKLDKILMPRELFKPSAAPAPAPTPEADAPSPDVADGPASDYDEDDDEVADQTAKKKNAGGRINGGGLFAVGLTLCYFMVAAL